MNVCRLILSGLILLLAACATGTIAQLKDVKVDLKDEKIKEKAAQEYEPYLDGTPESILRLADFKTRKEFDLLDAAADKTDAQSTQGGKDIVGTSKEKLPVPSDGNNEAANDFEERTTAANPTPSGKPIPGRVSVDGQTAGMRDAIGLYKKLINDYPNFGLNDRALYQLARIYEELGSSEEAIRMLDRLAKDYPRSRYIDEAQFRRGEYYYAHKKFPDARDAYQAVVNTGAKSLYYQFALYKLGWTYFKQEVYEEAARRFTTLLDHKIATGHDIDHPDDPFEQKRIDDTYRVISLSFSYLGGADAAMSYFNKIGRRTYEITVYKNLGNYYLEKRRYSDAAETFKAFVKGNPDQKISPYFYMWSIESYKKGGFTKFFIESDKEFIVNYGLESAYWKRFNIADFKEIFEYLKTSLKDMANYYHSRYQDPRFAQERGDNFREAINWYRDYLNSFPKDQDALAVHYQFADLLLENKSYGQAAVEYEHIAYDYPASKKSSDAGYAAVYALRKSLSVVAQNEADRVKREVIRSSLRFAETFPKSDNAPLVMSAAIDDMYGIKEYALAASSARQLLAKYFADQPARRNAWLIFAHSSFELGNFKGAEEGYLAALGLTAENDPSRADVIENLAASLYKEGEKASKQGDYKTAATYFFLVDTSAPTAKIRPVADFDGIAALLQIKDFAAAANALRSFWENFPGNPQKIELSKKLALAYKEAGELLLAAAEYERIAAETPDEALQRASLELAADLYTQAKELEKAYQVERRYVDIFQRPLEDALEMRSKIAAYLKLHSNMNGYIDELNRIMDADATGGEERTNRTRYLGAKAALDLAELKVKQGSQIKLESPFAESLRKKQDVMMEAKEKLEELFNYETDVVTTAATFYLAEMYSDFGTALVRSERPAGLNAQQKEQYELSIEEQADQFDEKAIQIHEKNLELMKRGIYDRWIERSIGRLAKLVPAKYARLEDSGGYIHELDSFNYAPLVNPKSASSSAVSSAVADYVPAWKVPPELKKEIEPDFREAMQDVKFSRFEKAITLLDKVVAKAPNTPVPYIDLALIHEKMHTLTFAKENMTLAEENLKQAIRIAPQNPVANNEFALLYRKTGRFSEARQIYEKVLDRYPNFLMARKNLGILCDLYMKDYACALKHYTIYSNAMPDDKTVKIWIAGLQKK